MKLEERLKQLNAVLNEDERGRIALDAICVESGALRKAAYYLAEHSFRQVVIAVDTETYTAAGRVLERDAAAEGVRVHISFIKPNAARDVVADEASIVQLLIDIQQSKAEAVIAAGSGTLHDISRYAAYTSGIPFISVPTAPSVDGFTSKGAPILVRGEKITIPAIGPDAIFADLDILTKAPPALVAAGFGDMLGKYTSLFDWKYGALTGGEPYLPIAAEMTRSALSDCVENVEAIASRSEEGIRTLIEALIESGLAMLLFGKSHPASGAEHHLSHYWEMEYIRKGRRQLLHGAKVGVACAEISKLYHRIAEHGFGRGGLPSQAEQHWDEIGREIAGIPKEAVLRELLRKVGGPDTVESLPIEPQLLMRSLREAHHVRKERHTLLRAFNEAGAIH